jgi:hypothetical protein
MIWKLAPANADILVIAETTTNTALINYQFILSDT